MKNNILKFGAGILGFVAIGAVVLYGVSWYQYRKSPEYAQKLEYEKLLEAYKNDTYGGSTPEETLKLFIDALKKGDTELAAKYFAVDEQEKWRIRLLDVQRKNVLNIMVSDLERLKLTKQNEDRVFFTLANEQRTVLVEMIFARNINNKWKIIEL